MIEPATASTLQDYREIAAAMQRCLHIKNRFQRLKIHKRCFVGREAVDFLMDYLHLETRQEALEMGRKVNEQVQCFEHVSRTHPLRDENVFYRFTDFGNRKECGTSLKEIARAFQKGVPVEDRTVRMRHYKKCFKGKHAVDFLVNYKFAETRPEAVALARRLQREYDLFVHVSGDRKFRDENVVYRMLLPKMGNVFDRTSQMVLQRPEVQGMMELWLFVFGVIASVLYVGLFQSPESLGFVMAASLLMGAALKYYLFGTGIFAINWFSRGKKEHVFLDTSKREARCLDASSSSHSSHKSTTRRLPFSLRDSTIPLLAGETSSEEEEEE